MGANQFDGAGVRRPSDRQPVQLAELALRAQQRQESGDAALHQDGGDQANLTVEQRPQRNRRIEGAKRDLPQPLLQRPSLGGNRRRRAFRQPAAGADVIHPRVPLQHHGNAGQLLEPGQQRRQPAPRQRQLAQLAVQVLRSLVQLGAPVDDIAQHLLLDLVQRQRGGQREQGQPVRIRNAAGLGRHPPQDRRPGHPLAGQRFEQAGEREPRVNRRQHLRIDQQQLATAKRGEGGRPGAQRRAPDHLAVPAGRPGDELALLG